MSVGSSGRVGRWAGRDVVEVVHVARQRAAQLVDARDQGFEMIAILDACVLGDRLEPLTLQANQVHAKDGVENAGGADGI